MDFLKEYSPSISGFQYYQWIENLLPTGDLSDPQSVDKTATEVKASKQRKYKRVTAIRENPMDCLENFVAGIVFYEGMNIRGYEFLCTFPLLQII